MHRWQYFKNKAIMVAKFMVVVVSGEARGVQENAEGETQEIWWRMKEMFCFLIWRAVWGLFCL